MKRIARFVQPLSGAALFLAAVWWLDHSLRQYHYHEILRDLKGISTASLLGAIGLTLANYFILTFYDTLGFRYIRHPLAYSKIALASFISYAFSMSLGFPVLTGGSVRYRFYSAWGLSTAEIAQIVAFSTLTFALGVLTVGGIGLTVSPSEIPDSLHLPIRSTLPIGIVFLASAVGYCILIARRREPLKIRDWEFASPPLMISAAQIVVSSIDWLLAALVLYVLLPAHPQISFSEFLGIFIVAHVLGLISHVPGGLGVFESVILVLCVPEISAPALIGSVVAYRGVYYLFPLALSALLLGAHEVAERKAQVQRIARFFGQWAPDVAPAVFAVTTFVGGIVLLFSGALPAAKGRLEFLEQLIPLPLLEVSHLLGSLAGVGLLLLARGLQRRLDAAYVVTVTLLATGLVASLLKGFDYEEAAIMAVLLFALLPCRRYFYRKASLFSERFSRTWVVAIILVLLSSVWLTLFSYKHVPYSSELWWKFTFSANAPRSLRAAVGTFAFAFVVALAQLFSAASPEPALPTEHDLERARLLIAKSPVSSAHLALLGDKELLFSESGNAFLMYGVEGRSFVALGDPVGPEEEMPELVWRFREMADRHDGWTVFYEVDRFHLPLYLDLGLTLLKLGEEARVPLDSFSMEGNSRKTFRHLLHKFQRDGYTFDIVPQEQVGVLMPRLQEISDSWMGSKNTREKGFSLGFFKPEYLVQFPAGLVRKHEEILAFINIWQSGAKEELSLDLMRYVPQAPNGVMDFLFVSLMLWGKSQGYRWFNLGMAPLSGLESRALASLWNRLGGLVFRHGEHFYNFQGLRQYKEKFDPRWEPRYMACPGGLALPRILTNLASLISGGLRGVVSK